MLDNVPPVNHVGSVVMLVGIQLLSHSLVYAVDPGVPSPKSAYFIFPSVGLCSQKSEVINPHHCQFAVVGVNICDAPQSIQIIANAKIPKA